MYDDDLEKTRALNELNELNTNNNVNSNNVVNNINNSNTRFFNVEDNSNDLNMEEKEALFNDLTSEGQVVNVDDNQSNLNNPNNLDNQNNLGEQNNLDNQEIKKKEGLIGKFKKLPKKTKIIIIVAIIVLFLVAGLLLFFALGKKKVEVKEELPEVVLTKDNYKYQNGVLTILDDSDNTLGTYSCENKSEDKCYVAYLSNDEDTFNVVRNEYEDHSVVKQRSQSIINRYVFIFDNESKESSKVKLYDMLDNKVLGEYLGVKQYDVETKNIAVLKNTDGRYGVVKFDNESQMNIIEFAYDYIGIMNKDKDNLIIAKNTKGYYLIDYSNNIKTSAFNGEIIDYNDEYVVVKQSNSKYSVYNYTGEEFNKDYDFISLINDKYVGVVKDKHLFIRGYSDNKYNEDGLELTNDDYIPVYTFDSKNKLTSTSYSYAFELHDNTLTVKLQNSDRTSREERINLKEGDISLKYKNYSYLNGKLYFYEDEDKKNVIGIYECKNKNTFTNDVFNNCYVARNTEFSDSYINPKKGNNSTIPIYNSRYGFIYDVGELASETNVEIKFYDFRENKLLGTYSAVDADVEKNVDDLTYKNTSSSFIIAKLKTGKTGVIEINNEKASVNINFEYDQIERANKDFIVKSSSGKWQIIYVGSGYTSAEFPGKIMNYSNSYVVVQVDDKVYIYNGDGTELSLKDGFDYIDISSKYAFGAVSNNKLRVFDYNGNMLSEDSVTLVSTRAFKLSSTASDVEVKVLDNEGNVSRTIKYNISKENKEEKEVDGNNEE